MKRRGIKYGARPKSLIYHTVPAARKEDDEPSGISRGHRWLSERWSDKRNEIIARDSGRCRRCGRAETSRGAYHRTRLVVHQIRRYYSLSRNDFIPGWMLAAQELITLCHDCHDLVHQHEEPQIILVR